MKIEDVIEEVKQTISILEETEKQGEYGVDLPMQIESEKIKLAALEKQLNGGWILFTTEYDEDLKINMLQGKIPDDEQEILVTEGNYVWCDTFMKDGIECYLDSGNDLIDKVIAWMPFPEPFKEVEDE